MNRFQRLAKRYRDGYYIGKAHKIGPHTFRAVQYEYSCTSARVVARIHLREAHHWIPREVSMNIKERYPQHVDRQEVFSVAVDCLDSPRDNFKLVKARIFDLLDSACYEEMTETPKPELMTAERIANEKRLRSKKLISRRKQSRAKRKFR